MADFEVTSLTPIYMTDHFTSLRKVSYNVVSKTLSVRGKEWQTLKCQ